MSDIASIIAKFVENAEKIAILGLGNRLRGDDAAGLLVCEYIKGKVRADIFLAETAPESYALKLLDGGYSHVIIVDTAISNYPPGTIFIVDKNRLLEITITTHSIPITLLVEILEAHNINVLIVGISPKYTPLSENISPPVRQAIEKLSKMLLDILS
mgnify:CR=1 FL=1